MSAHAAISELYRRYGLAVERRCARILGPGAEAQDAANEAFARALRALERAPSDEERLKLLYRVSTNVCLNLLRHRRRRQGQWESAVAGCSSRRRRAGRLPSSPLPRSWWRSSRRRPAPARCWR